MRPGLPDLIAAFGKGDPYPCGAQACRPDNRSIYWNVTGMATLAGLRRMPRSAGSQPVSSASSQVKTISYHAELEVRPITSNDVAPGSAHSVPVPAIGSAYTRLPG